MRERPIDIVSRVANELDEKVAAEPGDAHRLGQPVKELRVAQRESRFRVAGQPLHGAELFDSTADRKCLDASMACVPWLGRTLPAHINDLHLSHYIIEFDVATSPFDTRVAMQRYPSRLSRRGIRRDSALFRK